MDDHNMGMEDTSERSLPEAQSKLDSQEPLLANCSTLFLNAFQRLPLSFVAPHWPLIPRVENLE